MEHKHECDMLEHAASAPDQQAWAQTIPLMWEHIYIYNYSFIQISTDAEYSNCLFVSLLNV